MVFFTAEIGINHNGDLEIAKKLIDVAMEAGCDAVKFQKRTVEKYIQRMFWMRHAKVHGEKQQKNKN